jgi:hypothetical protein
MSTISKEKKQWVKYTSHELTTQCQPPALGGNYDVVALYVNIIVHVPKNQILVILE